MIIFYKILIFVRKQYKNLKKIIKLCIRKCRYNPNNFIKVDSLYELINSNLDIREFPKAKGLLREVQLKVLTILTDIKEICEQNNLCYWLDFGTLIGAVRHKGFIPWDADADISMPREDYLKLIPLLKQFFLNTEYIVRSDYKNHLQLRIQDKNNVIGVDIFPVDSIYFDKQLSKKEINNIIIKKRELLEIIILIKRKFSSFQINDIRNIIKDITFGKGKKEKQNKQSKLLFYGIDYPHDNNNFNPIEYEHVFPLKKIEFENKEFYCPNQVDLYLKTLYGNYMNFPKQIVIDNQVQEFLNKHKKEL